MLAYLQVLGLIPASLQCQSNWFKTLVTPQDLASLTGQDIQFAR